MAFMDKVKELGRKIVESGTIVEEIKKKAQALNKHRSRNLSQARDVCEPSL